MRASAEGHPSEAQPRCHDVAPAPADGHGITPDGIRTYLVGQLAGYKVPRRIEVQRNLPREDSGKIFKRRLRDPYWQGQGRRI